MEKSNILSFVILDELRYSFKPIEVEIGELTKDNIANAVDKVAFKFGPSGSIIDETEYYFVSNHGMVEYPIFYNGEREEVIQELYEDHYSVWNRWMKYYVIAWAINYTRFEVYSKDCDKELIRWSFENDSATNIKEGPIKGTITNVNYNQNPVVSFFIK